MTSRPRPSQLLAAYRDSDAQHERCHADLKKIGLRAGARTRAAIQAVIDANYARANARLRWLESLGAATAAIRAETDRDLAEWEAGYRELLDQIEKEARDAD